MGDEAIQEQIRREFQELCQTGRGRARGRETAGRGRARANNGNRVPEIDRQKSFELEFAFASKIYTTILQAQCETVWAGDLSAKQFSVKTKSLQKGRQCIDISITIPPMGPSLNNYRRAELHEFDSMISANSPENQCFNPVLTADRTNPNESLRYSSADVLQTLKTKLQYLLPNPHSLPIVIQDAATTKFVAMTPFNILREKAPFYAKYGFQYRNLEPILTILPSVSWMEIRSKPYFGGMTLGDRISQITKKDYREFMSILDILKEIPFEVESRENELFILATRPNTRKNLFNELSLSLAILRTIAKDRGYSDAQLSPLGGEGNLFSAIHDPTSPEWLAASNRLQLTKFRPISEGGKRKTHRKKRTQKN